jgi:predicted DNA-binding transcriptional regulator YafY
MSQKSSLQRVLEILNWLNKGEKLCVSQLAEHYEVRDRSIQRDFKIILAVFDDFLIKDGECYKGYKKVLLDELLQGSELMMLSNIVNVFDITDTKSLVSDETKRLIQNSMDVYAFKSRPIEQAYNQDMLKTMEHAIKFNKELDILYHGRYITNQYFQIQPYKLVFSVDNLYLIVKSPIENKIRKLRISNIETVKLTSKSFYKDREIEHYITSSQTLFANDASKDIVVRLHVSSVRSKYFVYKKYLSSQKIINKFENGDIEIEYHVNNFNEIDNLILTWMPEVTILEPQALKDVILKKLVKKLDCLD